LIISCPARLHLGLFSMNADMPRINGGIGFSIDAQQVQVEAKIDDVLHVQDDRNAGMGSSAIARLVEVLQKAASLHGLEKQVLLRISGDADMHYGLGTGTSIALASLEAFFLLNDHKITKDELIRLSNRGGTSGIGIYTYFSGGLVIDLGRASDGKRPIPSSQQEGAFDLPLLLQQFPMPDWEIGICTPSHIQPLTEAEEKTFFRQTCPIPEEEAYKALYYSVAGVYASAKDGDKKGFEIAVRALQKCAWKKAERQRHGPELRAVENQLYELGASVVGMSSLGPSLFFLAEDVEALLPVMQESLPQCTFTLSRPANQGRVVSC